MVRKWEYYNEDTDIIEKIAGQFQISRLLATILVNRGIVSEEDIKVFLNPTRNDFHDPFLLPDMKKAVDRIIKAMNQNEKIIIYGDYDVDGITSITVLKRFLEERGAHLEQYIPNRLEEGYGLNKSAIDEIVKDQYNLMITVDCGISSIEEIDYANSQGLETIITDHHEISDRLPSAIAVVNAKRKDSQYPFRGLARCRSSL